MATDNITLSAGSGGSTVRTLADSSDNEWAASVVCYATTVSAGANVLQIVTPSAGLPVAQQGTWTVEVSGSVAVTGAFWQTTQPVSQSGTWNVGTVTTVATVSAVTAITDALPAGTNLLGSIAVADQVAGLFNGTTPVTVQYANFATSSSGTTTIVSAVSGKKVYVLRWSVSANGNTNVNLQSHTTTGLATGVRYLTQYGSAGGAYCAAGIMATAASEALDVNNSAAVPISGEITFVQF